MTNFDSSRRFHRVAGRALLLGLISLAAACSSKDDRTMIYVNAPFTAYAGSAKALRITVTVDGVPAFERTVDAATYPSGAFGLPLPSGQSGNAVVIIRITDASNCVIATGGSAAFTVLSGEPAGPITITFGPPDSPCVLDAGAIDTFAPSSGDGPDPSDAVVRETLGPLDSLPIIGDGPSVTVDASGPDALLDGRTDAADVPSVADVPADAPGPDQPTGPEAGPEAAPDSGPDATPMSIFRNCTKYRHTQTTSSGEPMGFGVYGVLFTPDGKMVITLGEDGRAKVWDVTSTGLKENASKLVFVGNGVIRGAVSPDGKYLALGEVGGRVVVYDLPGSVNAGAASAKWTLPANALSPIPSYANARHFTTDGNRLVVVYRADSRPEPNRLVVWDLGTQTIVRTVDYVYDDYPYAVLPGDWAGPMWAASGMERTTDAGKEYVVTLTDVAQSGSPKVQVVVPDPVDLLAFSPDGKSLMVGLDTGEVSMWDISDKTKLVKPAAPLYAEGTGWLRGVYSAAFTSDSAYMAIGTETGEQFVVRLASFGGKSSLESLVDYAATAVAFSPDNLALIIGEHSDSAGLVLYCKP